VHGSSYPSGADIEAGWNSAKDFARRGLYRAVMDKFPTAEQFNKMTLGALCKTDSRVQAFGACASDRCR
jgi:hypothetical protein